MDDHYSIRFYRPDDAARVRQICVETAADFLAGQTDLLLCLFCDYYIEQEPENCLVAADHSDQAVGYLLLSRDWAAYRAGYRARYLPRLEAIDPAEAQCKQAELEADAPLHAAYPAHLHIDILPGHQGQRLGARLLDAGTAHLAAQGCPGLMLGVGLDNTGAIRFYQRHGFSLLEHRPGVDYYGLRLGKTAQ
ncbi:GNAT family N-acetyltransferase [Ruminococcaceae bacterium OttesenSCG-928-D13]|nr:GNAT family N-acetyltransferase [Ruminococcaceae bacterium OttesenSCG-928-D13]